MGKTYSVFLPTRKKPTDPPHESSSSAIHPGRTALCRHLGFLWEGTEHFVGLQNDGKGKASNEGSAGRCLPAPEEMPEGEHSFCL